MTVSAPLWLCYNGMSLNKGNTPLHKRPSPGPYLLPKELQSWTNLAIPSLSDRLEKSILVLDGAMGTSIQKLGLTADDFGGAQYEGCNEYLVLTKPDAIAQVHRGFLEAGADILETDTFGATSVVLAEYELAHEVPANQPGGGKAGVPVVR